MIAKYNIEYAIPLQGTIIGTNKRSITSPTIR